MNLPDLAPLVLSTQVTKSTKDDRNWLKQVQHAHDRSGHME